MQFLLGRGRAHWDKRWGPGPGGGQGWQEKLSLTSALLSLKALHGATQFYASDFAGVNLSRLIAADGAQQSLSKKIPYLEETSSCLSVHAG